MAKIVKGTQPRVISRSLVASDRNKVISMLRDDSVMRFLGPKRALTKCEATQWFKDELLCQSRYVIALKKSNELIGFCGVKVISEIADFGYFFQRNSWGKGYASEACELVIKKLQDETDISLLQVFIAKQNISSLAIAKKLNWQRLREVNKEGEDGYFFQLTAPTLP